jgi:hypothetical protein
MATELIATETDKKWQCSRLSLDTNVRYHRTFPCNLLLNHFNETSFDYTELNNVTVQILIFQVQPLSAIISLQPPVNLPE